MIHDLLAFLAQQMLDLNKQKQAEVRRFLSWLEDVLNIKPKKGETGLDSLKGRSHIQNYLGDYQKGEHETPFDDFYYYLHENRTRFGVAVGELSPTLADEYAKSMKTLIPIKRKLAFTDALIDKIVYQLYGLTEDEIKLIEYSQVEQAVTTAREEVLRKKENAEDPDLAVEAIAAKIEPAVEQYFARVDEAQIEAQLRSEVPSWDILPDKVKRFVMAGDLILAQSVLPEYSGVVIQYSKAAETILNERLFYPFRASHQGQRCNNEFLDKFVSQGRPLTLGNMPIILASNHEPALRKFVRSIYPQADKTVFAPDKLLGLLDQTQIKARNGAAHDGESTVDDAKLARQWAIEILRYV